MTHQLEIDLKEIKERATRIESRVVQLGDHVGANLRLKLRIQPMKDAETGARMVSVDCFDVSISRILSELQEWGWHGDVQVKIQGERIATLHVK